MATLTSTQGLVATIDGTGLTDLSLNGTTVLFGALGIESSGSRFGISGEPSIGALASSAIVSSGSRFVLIQQEYAAASARVLFILDGEDLTISVSATNRTGAPIFVLGLTGLLGNWTTDEAAGLLGATTMNGADVGIGHFHPCSTTPIGAAYRIPTGGAFGACLYPINLGLVRSLVYWYHRANFPSEGLTTPSVEIFIAPSSFRYPASSGTGSEWVGMAPVFSAGIHPNETYTCQFGIRVSSTTTWQHLLSPYKTQFNETFGACTYADARDDRPICVSFPGDETKVSEANPYGFNEGGPGIDTYRFDLSTTPWCDQFIAAMVAAGCQGVIFWTPNGWDTRFPGTTGGGINYNPDIHILPDEVEANRGTLLSRLEAESLTLGRESRTQVIRSRGTWTADYTYEVAATYGLALADLVARFATAMTNGFTRFYCDSFPSDFHAHLVLKALRDTWGPTTPLIYTEGFTDISLVYGGVYQEVSRSGPYSVGALDTSGGLSLNVLEIARWITPHTSVAVIDRTSSEYSTDYLDFVYQANCTPLVSDQDLVLVSGLPAALASRNTTYLTDWQFAGS